MNARLSRKELEEFDSRKAIGRLQSDSGLLYMIAAAFSFASMLYFKVVLVRLK